MILKKLQTELRLELDDILKYWTQHAIDYDHGGFIGRIDENNKAFPSALKGAVLNARICWSFSAAYRFTQHEPYKILAQRAFDFINNYFIDQDNGGVFWSVDQTGKSVDDKNQVYALAFVVYAFAEWHKVSGTELPLTKAVGIYKLIKKYAYDPVNLGYFEAYSRDWIPLVDRRLSGKDANEAKSMNTHLHLLEGFSNLYQIWPDETLGADIRELLCVFQKHIIDTDTGHLNLFFTEQWEVRSAIHSYGHDIEAGWLLQEAAEIVGDENMVAGFRKMAIKLTNAALDGWIGTGGIWYEYDLRDHHLVAEKHWWPQAEALVGLYNAFQVSINSSYLENVFSTWTFIQHHLKDKVYGEWYWGVDKDNTPMPGQDKVGIWKCPYHNVRACIELIRRIG